VRVLITGGAGFIGANLAIELDRRGEDVVVIDNFTSSNFKNLIGFRGEVVVEDMTSFDLSSRFDIDEFDAIFHHASITDTTYPNEAKLIHANLEGFRRVLQFALDGGKRLIYASSAGVYGDGPIPMREDQPLYPLNAYSFSKYVMENLATRYAKRSTPPIIGLRFFNVYGPGEAYKGKAASMIYQLASMMKRGNRPRIFKYGEQFRDFIYIKDAVRANILAMGSGESGIFNVGTGSTTTFNRIIEILNQVLGTSFEPEYFDNPYTSFYQNQTLADTHLARSALGFEARFTIEEGIRDYLSSWTEE
jgi:ADP-L-glycero-D-manno-heptose 6-epimerase